VNIHIVSVFFPGKRYNLKYMNQDIMQIYNKLLEEYGPQGWWPVYSLRNTLGRDDRGYFVSGVFIETNYRASLRKSTILEIAVGAILTQNTSWINVEKAIDNLVKDNLMDPNIILKIPQDELANAIRPSGYYNQKAKKLKILTRYLLDGNFYEDGNIPNRENLLELWGIGEETADSILLYAYGVPLFVIDEYTRRIFGRLGILESTQSYKEIAEVLNRELEKDFIVYQEYHALIVKHAKEHCRTKPDCLKCVLREECSFFQNVQVYTY
jgi:endonuclease-3 related protein